MYPEMTPFKVVILRGGTSKGIFIKENELPKDPETRNKVIRAVFGSPDRRQIDGLGGADVLTSKLAIIGPPTREDADVDYTFAQVSFDSELVDYGGNCGNISSGVGPFAIDEGLVPAVSPKTTVRIHQVNTRCILIAEVEVKDGKACVEGNAQIDGVPGTGSPVMLNFFDTAGSTTGKVLPTGNAVDTLDVPDYGKFDVSIVDAGNVVIFIEAGSLGLKGTENCADFEADKGLMKKIEAIRGAATVKIGLAKTPEDATKNSPYAPFFAVVSKSADYASELTGGLVQKKDIDLVSRLAFMLHMHKTYPGTGAVATGAAARIPGTLVYKQLAEDTKKLIELRIGHPGGIMRVDATAKPGSQPPSFERLSYVRTARRIMEGTVYIKNSVLK